MSDEIEVTSESNKISAWYTFSNLSEGYHGFIYDILKY